MTPAYVRVRDALRERIHTRELGPGDRLPSIAKIAEEYNVSKATAKFALAMLRDAGYIRGEQGVATYVADNPPAAPE